MPGTLPSVAEIDAVIHKQRQTLDAIAKMRDVAVAQETAFFQQAQEQQFKAQDEGKRSDSFHNADDAVGGGFAGPEAKKRRGVSGALNVLSDKPLICVIACSSSWQVPQL